MNTEQKFYVYEHIRPDTGAVFYVGKGCGKRAYLSTLRSNHWKNLVAKNGRQIRYIAKNLDEELAFLCEQEAINQYKRLGVVLINKTLGGEGTAGFSHKHSAESIKKMRLTKKNKPVYCVTTNKTYHSIREASRQLNVHQYCIATVCNNLQNTTKGYKFEWSKK